MSADFMLMYVFITGLPPRALLTRTVYFDDEELDFYNELQLGTYMGCA
jgi:hypothetical protein